MSSHRFTSAVFLVSLLVSGLPAASSNTHSAEKTVSLVIDFSGQAKTKRFTELLWREQMTVLDAMNAAKEKSPGLKFEFQGSGRTALLTKIDEVGNEGARGRNWIYRVNDKLGDRSFATFRLKAEDKIEWKFEKYP